MASEALSQLKELALADSRRRHPTLPESARYIKPYSDKSANQLTGAIIDWLRLNGHQGERINCVGRAIDNTKIITDILGDSRHVGSVKWLPTSGQLGTADISATININGVGRSVKIEVKMKDKQSEDQKRYQQAVERAGGLYWLVRSFDEFMELYNQLLLIT